MLAPDVDIYDLDGGHVAGWLELLVPPGLSRAARVALLFLDGGVVAKAIVTGLGEVEPPALDGTSHRALAAARAALEVDLVIAIEGDAIAQLMAEIEGTLRLGDDYAAQWVTIARAARKRNGHGLWLEPRLLDLIPPVAAEPLQRTFDLLVPDHSAIVAYVLADDRSGVLASLIAVKEAGHLRVLTTHLGIADLVSERELARDPASVHRRVVDAVTDRYAPPSVAVFLARHTFYQILTGPPDTLARELASGAVVLDPAPTWLRALIGGAAFVTQAGRTARGLARFIPEPARRAAEGLAAEAQARLKDSAMNPFALLGFDPLALLDELRRFYRRPS